MATGDIIVFNKFKHFTVIGGTSYPIDWDNNTLKLMLVTASYTPDYDAHDYRDDLGATEVTGSNYTAGGATLANVVVTLDTTNDWVKFDADNVTWSQHASGFSNARYGIGYKSTGVASQDPLLFLLDLGTTRGNVNGDLTINWNADGIIRFA